MSTMARISKTAAIQQASDESHMYRQGYGWVTSTWDEDRGANWISVENPWFIARAVLPEWRAARVVELLVQAGEREAAEAYAKQILPTPYSGSTSLQCAVDYALAHTTPQGGPPSPGPGIPL